VLGVITIAEVAIAITNLIFVPLSAQNTKIGNLEKPKIRHLTALFTLINHIIISKTQSGRIAIHPHCGDNPPILG
jgi:hypothetical protein